MTIHAYTDGASRGNPGESGIGIVLKDENGNTLLTHYEYVGTGTNNMAEYRALLTCLELVQRFPCERLIIKSDSELMVRQLQGKYRVQNAKLKEYFEKAIATLRTAPYHYELVCVGREENREADELANIAINLKESSAAGNKR
jgi:ribonuclease HI